MSKVIVTKEKLDTLANTIAYKSGVPVTMTIDEMNAAVKSIKTEFHLEEKTVTPSEKKQVVKPSENYDGLSSVTVAPISDEYIVPNGTITITQNGTYDVTGKAEASVNVSGGGVSAKALNFIDYDGSIVESYTAAEARTLTVLPDNPSHTGLVAQGWNWSLVDIKMALTAHSERPVNVGQMYKTASGKTEIDVTFSDPECLSPYLAVCLNGTCTIDWGDGSATETVAGTSYTTLQYAPHTYPAVGSYTITIDGNVGFYSNNSSASILSIKSAITSKRTYSQCITAIRLSETAKINNYAFNDLISVKYITIPDGVTSIGTYAFQNCYALTSITIPDGVTSIGGNAFFSCYALTSITIPDGVTSIGAQTFNYCCALTSITIPDSVTSIGGNAFQHCHALTSITIPDNVTSIGTYAFSSCYALTSITIPDSVTSITNYAFYNCHALASITIPDSVTNIGNNAFQHCYSILKYHFTSITPTTLGTNVFSGITSDTVIYVPQESVEAYKTATNWSTYASYIQGE